MNRRQPEWRGIARSRIDRQNGVDEDVQVDTDRLQLEDGDRLLLCSDGLTDLVDDQTITNILRETTHAVLRPVKIGRSDSAAAPYR